MGSCRESRCYRIKWKAKQIGSSVGELHWVQVWSCNGPEVWQDKALIGQGSGSVIIKSRGSWCFGGSGMIMVKVLKQIGKWQVSSGVLTDVNER